MVRYGVMVVKILAILLLAGMGRRNGNTHTYNQTQTHKRQTQLYSLVEFASLLYRSVLPIPVWFSFFMQEDYGVFSNLVAGMYVTFKFTNVWAKVKVFCSQLKSFISAEQPYGTYLSIEEVAEGGEICAILAILLLAGMGRRNGNTHTYNQTQTHKRQTQLYSLVEFASLLYRSVLPIPVWFSFFMQEDYGVFSNLVAGMYVTFKFTNVWAKVKVFCSQLKSFISAEQPYGTYLSIEEVAEGGEICAICQEKMSSPIQLHCKHIFCEDCVSEWFEREQTCPLCRSVVRSAGQKTHNDGTTSLVFELF
eukprot:TRINITY_DN7839_c0_g1_i1.p1 TRINITY_DN7839_c0_g1~~TRINITY_DN7839_c0_g1_i1.p1  ORF type:complete len:307 (-),score=73.23 TRINITY_DN7839_c0_g1_i1:236-1156(-)